MGLGRCSEEGLCQPILERWVEISKAHSGKGEQWRDQGIGRGEEERGTENATGNAAV